MNIELLYFDGCPTHSSTAKLIADVLDELGLEADVDQVHVRTEEEATSLRFLGSPSIRVDDVDIDPTARARTDFGRRCRVYPTGAGLVGLPPRDWLEASLRGEPVETTTGAEPPPESRACCATTSGDRVTLLVAEWCPQCPSAKAYWAELKTRLALELEVLDIVSDRGLALAQKHHVRAVPTAIVNDEVLGAGQPRPDLDSIRTALNGEHNG